MNKLNVKKGDTVVVISGQDKGKKGEILHADPANNRVTVKGANMITKHVKPTRVGQQGGIVKAESPIYACKVQLICPKCGKPTRVGHSIEQDGDKKVKMRVCKKCGAKFE